MPSKMTNWLQEFWIASPAPALTKKQTLFWWIFWAVLTALYFIWPIQTDFYTDEAYFSEMTLRFIQGQLPNVDFASNYLGLFYVYNALWFLALGASYFALRMGMLFLVSILFIPTIFFISRSFLPTVLSVLSTLLVLALTVSTNYSVSGNWYSLFFSALAVLFFLQSDCFNANSSSEKKKYFYPILIGLALGVSFLMKHTVALFTGSTLFLSLIWLATSCNFIHDNEDSSQNQNKFTLWLTILVVALLPLASIVFIHHHLDIPRLLFYVFPLVLISHFLIQKIRNNPTANYSAICQSVLLWIAAALIPMVLFCIPYALRPDGIQTLFYSVFVQYPKIYLNRAFLDYFGIIAPESWGVTLWLLISVGLLNKKPKLGWIALGIGFTLSLLAGQSYGQLQQWNNMTVSLYLQLPLWGIVLGLWKILWKKENLEAENLDLENFNIDHSVQTSVLPQHIWVSRTIWLWGVLLFLGTYPLGMMFYTGYAMTPFALLFVYWVSQFKSQSFQRFGVASVAYAIIFGILFAYHQTAWNVQANGSMFPTQVFSKYLAWDRAKIWVPDTDDLSSYSGRTQAYYALVKKYSQRADDWFMFSDGPEVYFLTHHTNPTRYSYAIDSTLSDGQDVIAGLEKHQVQFVLMELGQNHFMQPLVAQYLEQHFQLKERVGENILLFQRAKQ